MKTTMRKRIEELQARKHWKSGQPKWLHKPRILKHIKEAEMVSLSRESNFSKIPAELQLNVISFLDYEGVLKLKKTCRYFNYFINADVVKESKSAQIEAYQNMERTNSLPAYQLPCYTCLKMKAKAEFYDKRGKFYCNAQPIRHLRSPAVPTRDFDRYCIRCGFREGKFDPGTKLNTGGQSWMVCGNCGILSRETRISTTSGGTCSPCTTEYEFLRGTGTTIRVFQWVVALVIFPLACVGKAMPWTSRANEQSLRWICTMTLDLLTIGGAFASMCIRMQNNSGHLSRKRVDNCRFVFIVELTACACWIAILAALFHEGHQRHYTGRFDRFAKGLTAMVFCECLLFVLTTLWSNRMTRERLVHGTKRMEIV